MVEQRVIANRFEIESLAGSGGMGTVYRARDRESAGLIALKILNDADSSHDERFVREARALASLSHPGIVAYIAHGITPAGERYLATEWLEGEDLAQRLERGPLALGECLALAARVAEALAAAHARGIVHRDLKPANLFLREGAIERVTVLDFGIARLANTSLRATTTGIVLGTPAYMAPEQARGDKQLDARADVFALGCVVWECLTGRAPFAGEHVMAVLAKVLFDEPPPLSGLRRDVPIALAELVTRMLSKDPASRPANGAAVAAELAELPETPALEIERGAAITAGEQRSWSVVMATSTAPIGSDEAVSVLELIRAAVDDYGAAVERIVDGSIVVALAGSGAATDQAARAARCALSLRSLLGGAPLSLATTRSGTAGSFPVGEVIDRAAELLATTRLEADGTTPPPAIRLDETTAGLLDARFQVQATEAGFELHGERELAESARTLLGRQSSTVGRDRELQTLNALFDECVEDRVARAALITAPAGVGKSRIRHDFLKGIKGRDKPVVIWLGRGDPISAGSPFGMIGPAIRRAAGILEGESLAIRQMKLRARLSRCLAGADLQRVTEFLGELIGVPFSDEKSLALRAARQDARLMGDQMMRAWQDWLGAECTRQPVLIVLEDLHWGDPPTVSFTDAALRHLRDRPFMVLALARPEVHEVFPKLWEERDTQEIRLGELTRRASEKLVREVLGEAVPAGTVARIVELAAGNAFYLEELIRAVADGHTGDLPETVLAMVEARLQALEPEARRILRAASVFGSAFWRGSVAALLGGSEGASRLDDWLSDLVEREFVTRRPSSRFLGEAEFQFRHDLVRQTAHAMFTEGDRALGHRLAAEWLERMGENEAEVLAEHFERGGERTRAVPLYVRAAQQALGGNDLEGAIRRAERGVACGASGEVLGLLRMIQAEAHDWRSEFVEGEISGREAMELLPRGSEPWARAFNFRQWASGALGKLDEVEALLDEMLDADPGGEVNGAHLTSLAWIGHQLISSGKLLQAQRAFRTAETWAARPRWIDERADAEYAFARSSERYMAGEIVEFAELCDFAAKTFEEVGDLRHALQVHEYVGFCHLQIGLYERAEETYRRVIELGKPLGFHHLTAGSRQNLGYVLMCLGELEEARAIEDEAVQEYATTGNVKMLAQARMYMTLIHLRSRAFEEAEHGAREAIEHLEAFPPLRCFGLAVLARVLLERGRADEALAATTESMALLFSCVVIEEDEALPRLAHAEALEAHGDHAAACDAIRIARDRLHERAAKITRAQWHESFLHRVPEHARTLELAQEWIGEARAGSSAQSH